MPDAVAGAAGPAAGQPADDLVVVDDQLEHDVELGLGDIAQDVVELLRLGDGAREAVEQEPLEGVGLGQPVAHHLDRHVVRHQVTAVHERLGLHAQWGAVADVGPEDVPRADLGHAAVLGDELGLRPLARSRWPHQDEAH